MASPSAIIRLEGVTRLYGSVLGVNDLDFVLPPGSYGLVGPNGSGKSTLLHLLTGQLRPTLGQVRVFGRDPVDDPVTLGRIGLCPERDVLHPRMTGLGWVTALTALHGVPWREARERAARMLAEVGLADAMERRILTWSRGMRARARIAQALAHEPDLAILDEPFNGLDPVGRHEIVRFLQAWVAEGRSLLVASHVLEDVEALASSFLLLYRGRLLASGRAREIRALLADVPHELHLRGGPARELARLALGLDAVVGVRMDADEGGLRVETRSPLELYGALPGWIEGNGVRVEEVRGGEAGLEALFLSLVREHRGERSR